jgi:hypothetical protein
LFDQRPIIVSRNRFRPALSLAENGFIRLENGFVGTVRMKPVHEFATAVPRAGLKAPRVSDYVQRLKQTNSTVGEDLRGDQKSNDIDPHRKSSMSIALAIRAK